MLQVSLDTSFLILTEDRNTLSRLADRLRQRGQAHVRLLLLTEGFTPGRLETPSQEEFLLPPTST